MIDPALPKPNNLVQTIERSAAILDVLAHNPQGVSIKALSLAIGLPKGTTHRLVTSLAYFGFVRQDSRSRDYSLGFRLVELGNLLLGHLDLRQEAESILRDLAERLEETIHLVVLDGKEIVYIDKKEADRRKGGLRMASRIGLRNPIHSCAVGKAILAFAPEGTVNGILKDYRFLKRAPNTLADEASFREHLKLVRYQGYAVDEEENEKGIRCVAAPIFNEKGAVVAAVSISGPAFQVTRKLVEEKYSQEVVNAAWQISQRLGCQVGKGL